MEAVDERETVFMIAPDGGKIELRSNNSITDLPNPAVTVHVVHKKLTFDFKVDVDDTCRVLINMISKKFRIKSLKKIRLTCMCRELKAHKTLRKSGVVEGSLVFLYVKGGGYSIPADVKRLHGTPVDDPHTTPARDKAEVTDIKQEETKGGKKRPAPVHLGLKKNKGGNEEQTALERLEAMTPKNFRKRSPRHTALVKTERPTRSESVESDASWISMDSKASPTVQREEDLDNAFNNIRPLPVVNANSDKPTRKGTITVVEDLSNSDIILPDPPQSDPGPQIKLKINDKSLDELTKLKPNCISNLPEKKKWHRSDFETIAVIGRGAFGEVRVVVFRGTDGPYYAMKSIPKKKVKESRWRHHMTTERDLLAAQNEWLVNLYLSFQDRKALYLIMEFCAAGDFLSLLRTQHKLSESATVFYMAELTLAINAVHEMGYVHRDLKPDNILLDQGGHIKLSDFGLAGQVDKDHSTNMMRMREVAKNVDKGCYVPPKTRAPEDMKQYQETRRQMLFSMVGTPDYMAPEVLRGKGYGRECDWWSLGVITFECLMGYPPFWSESKEETCKNIIQYTQTFRFPKKSRVSWNTKDFIFRLICIPKRRMGFRRIQKHKFCSHVDWDNIRRQEPPFNVRIDEDDAGLNFDEYDVGDSMNKEDSAKTNSNSDHLQLEDDSHGAHFENWTMRNPVSPEFYKNNRLLYRRKSSNKDEARRNSNTLQVHE